MTAYLIRATLFALSLYYSWWAMTDFREKDYLAAGFELLIALVLFLVAAERKRDDG